MASDDLTALRASGPMTNRIEAQRLIEEKARRFACPNECDHRPCQIVRDLLAQLDALSTEHAALKDKLDTATVPASFDAMVWAKEWCRIAREIQAANDGRVVIDEGWMVSWFANALMRGYDEGRKGTDARQ